MPETSYVQKALKAKRPMAPSRKGRVHLGAYLPADFKRGIRMLQAVTDEAFQNMLARMLNEEFRRHGLPEVKQEETTAA